METAGVNSSSSTAQIIVIIVLVIIAIVLFVIFIVVTVNIPTPIITPFADGSIIKIRSLANNLYLRPVACNLISGCTDPLFETTCGTQTFNNIVAAIGTSDQTETTWVLCQNSTIGPTGTNTGEAKYLIYSQSAQGTQVMALNAGILVVESISSVCIASRTNSIDCGEMETEPYFSFLLNEKVQQSGNTTSGSYQIVLACSISEPLVCSGQGIENLNQSGCPPFVVSSFEGQNYTGCTFPTAAARCTLNTLFEIEVIGQST